MKTGLAKSIVTKGRFVMEFAKKFFIPERADMVPFRESISSRLSTSLSSSLVAKYHLT